MQKHLTKDKRALSSLGLIILLLIAAIIGGIISYLWVTGYYVGLKQKIPAQDTVAITNLSFNPQNATSFNVTLLNPSYSPNEKIGVASIVYSGQAETTLHAVQNSTPPLTTPYYIPKGTNQTFTCRGDLSAYVNQTVRVYAFVLNGSGSTNYMKIPYTKLFVSPNFDTIKGIKNYTITLRNPPSSAANLTITAIGTPLQPAFNSSHISPTLPYTLHRNQSVTLLISGAEGDWTSYSNTGSIALSATTREGYQTTNTTQVPKIALSIQQVIFNASDTNHFNVTVKNLVSTNTPLNVSKIEVAVNQTLINATPPLNSHNNTILGGSTTTFQANWNWTKYRGTSVSVKVSVLQGVSTTSPPQTTVAAAPLKIVDSPTLPDSQHVLIKVQNPSYASKTANVTNITVTLINGTAYQIPIVQPAASPYLIGIGNTTMFSALWNWQGYLGNTATFSINTDEGTVAFRAIVTPSSLSSNDTIYLTIPTTPVFNTANTGQFEVAVHNALTSSGNATITRIAILPENGTPMNSTFTSQTVTRNSTLTFTCTWDWTGYRGKNIVILIYTSDGLKTIFVMKTPA